METTNTLPEVIAAGIDVIVIDEFKLT